ncbi:MAG: hypothetical protein DCC51_16910 [Anaerolineae bacterium]|nr:MAG: hypothetical protein DCC51_16910 [Anaerolineae bacterium]
MLLAGDIGGTKTVLALFDVQEDAALIRRHPVIERTFPSQQYQSLDLIIEEFLSDGDFQISAGSFGVAGPIVGDRAQVTNLPWIINAADMRERFGFTVHLLNDLEALATAVPHLERPDLITLSEGLSRSNAAPSASLPPAPVWGRASSCGTGRPPDTNPTLPRGAIALSVRRPRYNWICSTTGCLAWGTSAMSAFAPASASPISTPFCARRRAIPSPAGSATSSTT